MRTLLISLCVAGLALAAAGCEDGRTRPPSARLQVVHAAPGFATIDFRRARSSEAVLEYLASSSMTFDSDTYTFNLEVSQPDSAAPTPVGSFTRELGPDFDHFFVLAEVGGVIEPLTFARTPFSPSDSNAEFSVVHAAGNLGEVDFYLEEPGTDLSTATPRGSVAFLGEIAPATTSPASYVVSLTEAGNPANILFASASVNLSAGTSVSFVIGDGGGQGIAPIFVAAAGDAATVLIDASLGSAVRAVNTVGDRLARDVYLDNNFTTPLIAGLEFGMASGFEGVGRGDRTLSLTPAGNSGTVESEQNLTLVGGRIYNMAIGGGAGETAAVTILEDHRRIAGQARFLMINGVNHYDNLVVYVEPPGTDIDSVDARFLLSSPSISNRTAFAAGERELTLRDAASGTVIYGPVTISMAGGGIYTAVAIDNADGSTADVVFLDDFN